MLERFPLILRPFLSKISNTKHHALLHKGLFCERPIKEPGPESACNLYYKKRNVPPTIFSIGSLAVGNLFESSRFSSDTNLWEECCVMETFDGSL